MAAYRAAGADGFGLGGGLYRPGQPAGGDAAKARAYVAAAVGPRDDRSASPSSATARSRGTSISRRSPPTPASSSSPCPTRSGDPGVGVPCFAEQRAMFAGLARQARRGRDLHAARSSATPSPGRARGRAARPARKAAGGDAGRDRGSGQRRPRLRPDPVRGLAQPACRGGAGRGGAARGRKVAGTGDQLAGGCPQMASGPGMDLGSRAASACSIRASMPCRSRPGSCPSRLFVREAALLVPANKQAPIAASIAFAEAGFRGRDGLARMPRARNGRSASRPRTGTMVELRDGGARLLVDGVERTLESRGEYPALYDRFATLIAARRERSRPRAAADRRRALPRRAARNRGAVRMTAAWTRPGNEN